MVETHVYTVSADPSLFAHPLAPLLDLFLAWQDKTPNALFRKLAWLGRCSLGLYATHLSLFFSTAMPGGSWAARVAARLSFFEIIGLAAVLLALSVALSRTCVCGVNWVRQKIHLAKFELGLL